MNFLDLMKIALTLKQMPASNSPAFTMNTIDWAKLLRDFWVLFLAWFSATVLPWLISQFLGYSDTLLAHQYIINGTNYTMAVTFALKLLIQAAKQWAGGPKA